MVNYQNSIIYKICCKDVNIKEIYVGSTANQLRIRKSKHKYCCNNENDNNYNLYVYQFIRQNGGFDNWDVVIVENVKCENKQELHKKERFYIEELGAELNKQVPSRSLKEWYKDNKETILEKKNQKFNCDCGGKYTYINKAKHLKSKKHQTYLQNLNNNN